ncbi:winged helix-turn-helix transcriptional regulator [Amycolatopsis sp. K13G38]|uniref:Winged helix-turn-helix transcriptional regulator n=1 Tax=Amycolatopsis acididurans TaxID=2724524 RepID=A0ABX1JAF8_9PSEU|nr:winged helix-turn-helix domain-containing protein [Amycolatopsis acididurans]NKQ56772.1 winged helix-turn-helix transcriptional regulator [Amycolatopsis acididurans]
MTTPDAPREQERPTTGRPGGEPGYVYQWVADQIAAQIESGELAPHAALPSERMLASAYGVSLGTARHATQLLRFRGLVVTVRAKGTYVADRKRN